jgi:FAD/FMN-containing dehydrogenase/Fe-S oxidoreductase
VARPGWGRVTVGWMAANPSPEDVRAALHRAGVAEVDTGSRRRAEYSSDASLYRVLPGAVVFPRSGDEAVAVVDTCRGLGVPVTVRGAGTSIAGNAVGTGVVVDFSRHLNRVLSVDPEQRTATVEPGVVLDDLQRVAQPHGLRFGPDPSTHSRCTIGGMIGNNACGSRALGYGRTVDNVLGLAVCAGTGERLTLGRGEVSSPVLTRLREVVRENLGVIRTEFGRFSRQVSGYSLEHLLPERGFDVAKTLVGSEGTAAMTLRADLRLVPRPSTTVLLVLGYPDMAASADAVPALLAAGGDGTMVAVEGLDSRIVDVVRRRRGPAAVPPLPEGGGWLFVELAGESVGELESVAAGLIGKADAGDSLLVTDPAQAGALWRIREDGSGLAARSVKGDPAHAGWEDAAVPPDRLGDYLRDFERLLREFGLSSMPYGHFGDGCVHARIDFPLSEKDGTKVFRDFLLEAARVVSSYGGSISGEHGDGRARGELLPAMYSPAALATFAAVKDVFDPGEVLNPGVIVRPRPVDADLRVVGAPPVRERLALAYHDDHGDFTAAVHRCTGVGKCRADTTGSGGVMCPSYLATRDERDSTRGRARVLQEMVRGALPGGWRAGEVRDVLDLCLSCKGCASDCPTGIDMASYKAEALHQAYRRRPRPAAHYALGWLPRWARLASRAPKLANRLLANGSLAAVAKRFGGMDARRELPRFAERTFRQWFADHPPPRGTRSPVLLWVDTFTDYFEPQVGIAAVRVLEAAGFEVRLPSRGVCCGLTWISTGQLDAARRILRRSVEAISPQVRAGVPMVGLEPSCTAVFRSDATELLRGPAAEDAAAVSDATHTLAELLSQHAPQWTPPLDGTRVLVQPHCHQHAIMGWETDRAFLRDAGAEVDSVGGCCGLAGNFGVERGHYEVSVKIAETTLLPAVRAAGPDRVVLADGFSCRTQLDQLGPRRGRHLAELLADHLPEQTPQS